MRFDEFVLRVPGDEFRIRFHENLTVLAGVGPEERSALVDSIIGALTGDADGATLRATDHTGRPVELTALGGRVRARFLDDEGGSAPPPVGWFANSAEELRSLLVVTAEDLGVADDLGEHEDDSPELADARAALWLVEEEARAATDAREAVEASLVRMGEIDEAIRVAEADATRREYVAVIAELERVRDEAEAVRSSDEAIAADDEVLAEAFGLHQLAERWRESVDTADSARLEVLDDEELDPHDVAWLIDVPDAVPADLPWLLRDAAEADRQVRALQDALHDVATASLPEQPDERVIALASVDQTVLWERRDRVLDARGDLERERLRVGGMGDGPPSSLVEAMEEAHARWEAADAIVQERQVLVVGGGALVSLLALPVAGLGGPILAALILIAVVGGVAALLGRPVRDRLEAERDEKAALEPLSTPTYLSFHLRRIDATLDPSGRDRLELAEAEMRLADRAWTAVAGPIRFSEANELEAQIRAFAAQIGDRHGVVEELGELRRVLERDRIPAAEAARRSLLDAVVPYGMTAADLEGAEPEVITAHVAARVDLGVEARRRRTVLDAEAEEQKAAALLDEVLVRLGYADGVVGARLEAAAWTIDKARERHDARATARPLDVIDRDLHRLAAEATRLHRPEFAAVTADAGDDVEALQTERDELSASLTEYERAGADLERLSTQRTELRAALAELETQAATERGENVHVERVRTALLAHLARVTSLGPMVEPLPVVLDDPLCRVPAECKWELMDMLRRLGEKTQVLYLTDDAFIGAWARRRAQIEESITLLEPVD